MSTAHNTTQAIDSVRRQARFTSTETMEQPLEAIADGTLPTDASDQLEDDSPRLIFTCCHPALAPDAQVALTLQEAIRLTRLIATVLPHPPLAEVHGLLALMLLHQSRRAARTDSAGKLIPLEEQDRTRWNADLIAERCALVEKAPHMSGIGPYTLQAAISAVRTEAHAARADLCRRLQRWDDARASYQAALARVQLEPERRFLVRRLSEITN